MTLPNSIRVGGEIDAACNKCELTLAHTIIAMVGTSVKRVQCNTCSSQHMFRGEQPLRKNTSLAAPRKSTARVAKAVAKAKDFDELLKGKDLTKARKYSIKETFKADDVVDHPTFGFGIVSAVRVDKVDITFKSDMKTLAHGKIEGPRPAFSPPKGRATLASDEAAANAAQPAPEAPPTDA